MQSRIRNTNDKYAWFRLQYFLYKITGHSDKAIREKLGLTSQQFYALIYREPTHATHRWNAKEEDELVNLYKVHGTWWEPIRDALNSKFHCSLSWVQVKNKMQSLLKKPKYQEKVQGVNIPKGKRGRPRFGVQNRRVKRQVYDPENQGNQGLMDEILTLLNQAANQLPLVQEEINGEQAQGGQGNVNNEEIPADQEDNHDSCGPTFDLGIPCNNGLGLSLN